MCGFAQTYVGKSEKDNEQPEGALVGQVVGGVKKAGLPQRPLLVQECGLVAVLQYLHRASVEGEEPVHVPVLLVALGRGPFVK